MIETWFLSEELLELNSDMASLELQELANDCSSDADEPKKQIRRSSRIKNKINLTIKKPVQQTYKSKCNTNNTEDIEKYYLSTKIKRLPSRLETIYEEPKTLNNTFQYMTVKKFKRTISFEDEDLSLRKNKRSKKRTMKAKKISATNRKILKKKVSMDVLLHKLESIEDEDVENSHK